MKVTILLNKYENFIFDLDNTLYDETEYLFRAYQNIAGKLSGKNAKKKAEYFKFLKNTFLKEGRQNLFDKFLINFGLQ